MKKTFALILLTLIFFCGCEAALLVGPAIQAYVMWKNGEGFKYYNYDYNTTYRATEKALHDLGYTIAKEQPTKKGTYILAKSKQDFKINVERTDGQLPRP